MGLFQCRHPLHHSPQQSLPIVLLQVPQLILSNSKLPIEWFINPFSPDSAKSKIHNYKLGKIDKQTAPRLCTAQQFSNEWSHFRVLSIESKARELCITQGSFLNQRVTPSLTIVEWKKATPVNHVNRPFLFTKYENSINVPLQCPTPITAYNNLTYSSVT